MRALCLLLAALMFTGCIRETPDVSQNTPSRSEAGPSPVDVGGKNAQALNPPSARGKDFPGNRPGGAAVAQQRVELTEYAVRMPQSLAAGQQSFFIVNSGKEKHSVEIEGNGMHVRLPSDLPRGEEASMEVTLKPGTYTVYCPVANHKQKGMTTQITVK